MNRFAPALWAVLFLTLAFGCSPLPPQSVSLYPQVKVPTGNVGKGRTVAFKVVDARPGKGVVGYRDASGSQGAPITVEGDLAQVVGEPASKVLTELGFKPAPYKDGAPLSLVITVRELSYKAQSATVTKKIAVKCSLSAKVTNGMGHWEGSFPVGQEREVAMTPDENANARFLNDVLSESLNMLLSDPEMIQYLAK